MKSIQIALLLALFLPVAAEVSADSRPSKSSSSSYKSGFSSQKSSSTSSNRSSSSSGASSGRSGGFGSFGKSAPRQERQALPQRSDSALSQSMNKSNAESNALRTLEARRAAQQAARAPREIQPVPSGPLPSNGQYNGQSSKQYDSRRNADLGQRNSGNSGSSGYGGGYNGGGMPAPVIVQQNNGLVNVITGFLLAKAVSSNQPRINNNSNSNNNNNGYPNSGAVSSSDSNNSGMASAAGANSIPVQSQPGSSWGMAILRTMAWLAILAVLGWLVYFGWKFLRRGKAPSTANYSFERN